jgi:hypothetical protein
MIHIKVQKDENQEETAWEEAVKFSVFKNYNTIKNSESWKTNKFHHGYMMVMKYIITCVKHDKEYGDYWSEENNKDVILGGKLLNEYGGFDCMREVLSTFVPKRYQREIDIKWDGIGKWKG